MHTPALIGPDHNNQFVTHVTHFLNIKKIIQENSTFSALSMLLLKSANKLVIVYVNEKI